MARAPQLPPYPSMPAGADGSDSVVFNRFDGLKNTVTRERLGPHDLEIATNIDLDDAGQAHRRRGVTQVASGEFHSLYTSDDFTVYGVYNGSLCIIRPDYSLMVLQGGVGSNPLSYEQVGPDVYFSSLTASGHITGDDVVLPWGAEVSPGTWLSPVVNPTATLQPIRGKLLGQPPMATQLAYLNGRIYLANGRTLWATELYLYNYVDKTKNFLHFEDDITFVGRVPDGLYVGTKSGLWWLSGPFTEMRRIMVVDHPIFESQPVYICADLADPSVPLNQASPDRNAVMFTTNKGICVGLPGGVIYNKTEDRVWLPDGFTTRAAAMYRRQDGINSFVVVLDSQGQPTDAARIGENVDAVLIRGGVAI